MISRHLACFSVVIIAGLSACGGGSSSGGKAPSPSPSSQAISSSSQQSLSSEQSSISSQQSSSLASSDAVITQTITGVAAVGAPIVGGEVVARCTNGRGFHGTQTVITQSDGRFTAQVEVGALPCALQVTYDLQVYDPVLGIMVQGRGSLHSFAGEFGVVNITPFTDLIIANASNLIPLDWFLSSDWLMVQSRLLQAQSEVRARLLAANFNLPSLTFEPFTTPFVIGDPWDQVLDDLQDAINLSNGSYQDLLELVKDGNLSAIPSRPVRSSSSRSSSASISSRSSQSSVSSISSSAGTGSVSSVSSTSEMSSESSAESSESSVSSSQASSSSSAPVQEVPVSCGDVPSGIKIGPTIRGDTATGPLMLTFGSGGYHSFSVPFLAPSGSSVQGQVAVDSTAWGGFASRRNVWISHCPGGESIDPPGFSLKCFHQGFESIDIRWSTNYSRTCQINAGEHYYINIQTLSCPSGNLDCHSAYIQNIL